MNVNRRTLNPRVWMRDWLNKPTRRERELSAELVAQFRADRAVVMELDQGGYPVGFRRAPVVSES